MQYAPNPNSFKMSLLGRNSTLSTLDKLCVDCLLNMILMNRFYKQTGLQ